MGNSVTPQHKDEMSSLSHPVVITWAAVFGVVATVTVIGNALTIAVFSKKRLLRRRTHYFLISLAVADMMVGAVAIPLYIYLNVSALEKGTVAHVFEAIDILSGLASVFTLAMIALERLYAIGWPLQHRVISTRYYFLSIALAWVLAMAISLTNLLYRYNIAPYIATLDIVLASLVISVVVILTSYAILWFKVHFRELDGRARRHDNKLAKTLSLVTGVFLLTWLPFQLLLFIIHFCKTCPFPSVNLICFIKLLQFSNSFVNTAIYSFKMPEFRQAITQIFKRNPSNVGDYIEMTDLRRDTLETLAFILHSYSAISLGICAGSENMATSAFGSFNRRTRQTINSKTERNSSRNRSRFKWRLYSSRTIRTRVYKLNGWDFQGELWLKLEKISLFYLFVYRRFPYQIRSFFTSKKEGLDVLIHTLIVSYYLLMWQSCSGTD